jgi:hypothetical protein
VILAALAALAPSAAFGAACTVPGHEAPPKVAVSSSVAEPVYRQALSRHDLSRQVHPQESRDNDLGRARSDTLLTVSPRVWTFGMGGGRHCVAVESVDVTWRIETVTVDIASEYRPGSCAYQAIKEHEDEHVRLTRGAFAEHLPRLKAAAAELARDLGPAITTADGEAAAREVATRFTQTLQPVVDSYQREIGRRNAVIDTPESYAAVQRRCKQW